MPPLQLAVHAYILCQLLLEVTQLGMKKRLARLPRLPSRQLEVPH